MQQLLKVVVTAYIQINLDTVLERHNIDKYYDKWVDETTTQELINKAENFVNSVNEFFADNSGQPFISMWGYTTTRSTGNGWENLEGLTLKDTVRDVYSMVKDSKRTSRQNAYIIMSLLSAGTTTAYYYNNRKEITVYDSIRLIRVLRHR